MTPRIFALDDASYHRLKRYRSIKIGALLAHPRRYMAAPAHKKVSRPQVLKSFPCGRDMPAFILKPPTRQLAHHLALTVANETKSGHGKTWKDMESRKRRLNIFT